MRPITVALAADRTYRVGLLVAVRSLLEQIPEKCNVEIHILDGGLGARDRDHIARTVSSAGRSASVRIAKPSLSAVRHAPPNYRGSIMPYARLLLPEIVPDDRVIYIDSDMVIQKNIAEIWDLDFGGTALAAVRDGLVQTFGGEMGTHDATINPRPYFNSGFLVMDLAHWRRTNVAGRVLRLLSEEPRGAMRYWDQSALNRILADDWVELDASWNAFPKMIERSDGALNPDAVNLHFVAGCKPWLYGNSHWNFMDRFYRYLDLTTLAGWRPSLPDHLTEQIRRRIRMLTAQATSLLQGPVRAGG